MHLTDALLADAWPPAEVELLGTSRLRWTWGLTRRANSVLVASDLGDDAVARAEAFYAERGVPARFQVSTASAPPGVAAGLAARGYEHGGATTVLRRPLGPPASAYEAAAVRLAEEPSAAWFEAYWAEEHRRYGAPDPLAAERCTATLLAAGPPVAFASLVRDGAVVAVGQGVVRAGGLAVQCMATSRPARRTGAATAVLAALLAWGAREGARSAALAVLDGNAAARRLYGRAGFRRSHTYAYWTAGGPA